MTAKHRKTSHRGTLTWVLLIAIGLIGGLWYGCNARDEVPVGAENEVGQPVVAAESMSTPPVDAPVGRKYIHIDKQTMTLTLYEADGSVRARFGVCTGKGIGNKQRKGDMKTPEGSFSIQQIQDASSWSHDFGDGLGVIEGAYGPWFIRLAVPGQKGIGIHGTHKPSSIGTRDSEGCIRLENHNVDSLRHMVEVGMPVIITPGDIDVQADANNGNNL